MFLKHAQTHRRAQQQGSMLVLAIFVMVVMLLLGTALVRVLSTGNETLAYEVLGTRAYNTASAGMQSRLGELFPVNSDTLRCDDTDASIVNTNMTTGPRPNYLPSLQNVPGLKNCRVSDITCSDFQVDGVTYYTVVSTGQCDANNGEVTSRTIEVEARSIN